MCSNATKTDDDVMDMDWFSRFLLVGRSSNSYLSNSSTLMTVQSTHAELSKCVTDLVAAGKHSEMIAEIRKIGSVASSSAKAYVLAVCAMNPDQKIKADSLKYLPTICPDSKDLFAFVQAKELLCKESNNGTGWGRSMRNAVRNWYKNKQPKNLAVMCDEHRSRDGSWTHYDVLRLTHFPMNTCGSTELTIVVHYLLHDVEQVEEKFAALKGSNEIIAFLKDFARFRKLDDEVEAANLIEKHSFPFESIPTSLRKSSLVLRRIIPCLQLDQLLILLKQLNKLGLLTSQSEVLPVVLEQLTNDKIAAAASKLHPIDVYVALNKYEEPPRKFPPAKVAAVEGVDAVSKAVKPKRPPVRVPALVNALKTLMATTIKNYPPTAKRYLVAVGIHTTPLKTRVFGFHQIHPTIAAALIILPLIEVEKQVTVVAFSSDGLVVLDLKAGMSLEDASKIIRESPRSLVNCAEPMLWAKQTKRSFDAFLILTNMQKLVSDEMKPLDALRQYRQEMALPNSRAVISAMCVQQRESVDGGPGVMYVVGLDHHALDIIREYFAGSGEDDRDVDLKDRQVMIELQASRLQLNEPHNK